MVETIQDAKWHWYNVQKDLINQGELKEEEIIINPFSVDSHGCGGEHKGNPFYVTWVKDRFLLVTSKNYDSDLIEAFARVVEYRPFARYKESDSNLITTEWDKINPEERYNELLTQNKSDLTRLL